MATALRFYPDGQIRAIHDDAFPFEKAFGKDFAKARRRASIIHTVEEGPYAGYFYADMSQLADRLGEEGCRVCLWPPQKTEAACKAQEFEFVRFAFINEHFRPVTEEDLEKPVVTTEPCYVPAARGLKTIFEIEPE